MQWLLVILMSAGTAFAVTFPLRKRMRALESMVEMLMKEVQRRAQK